MDFTRATELSDEVSAAIHDAFGYHDLTGNQRLDINNVTLALLHAVKVIVEKVPPSPDRSAAIRKIREAKMDCSSAITHRGKY